MQIWTWYFALFFTVVSLMEHGTRYLDYHERCQLLRARISGEEWKADSLTVSVGSGAIPIAELRAWKGQPGSGNVIHLILQKHISLDQGHILHLQLFTSENDACETTEAEGSIRYWDKHGVAGAFSFVVLCPNDKQPLRINEGEFYARFKIERTKVRH
jgi:hypothetical protein